MLSKVSYAISSRILRKPYFYKAFPGKINLAFILDFEPIETIQLKYHFSK